MQHEISSDQKKANHTATRFRPHFATAKDPQFFNGLAPSDISRADICSLIRRSWDVPSAYRERCHRSHWHPWLERDLARPAWPSRSPSPPLRQVDRIVHLFALHDVRQRLRLGTQRFDFRTRESVRAGTLVPVAGFVGFPLGVLRRSALWAARSVRRLSARPPCATCAAQPRHQRSTMTTRADC